MPGGEPAGRRVGINQAVWDPATLTLHVESGEVLNQHTCYALIVTRGVRDAHGNPVLPSDAFLRFRHDLNFGQTQDPLLKAYRKSLLDALKGAAAAGIARQDVVVASVFTTMSTTAVMERIRDQIKAATPDPADFQLGMNGERTVFSLSEMTRIVYKRQVRTVPAFESVQLPLFALRDSSGSVGSVAFGRFLSPNYMTPQQIIPPVGTRTGVPQPQGANEIFFYLYLPAGAPPPAGGRWPSSVTASATPGASRRCSGLPPWRGTASLRLLSTSWATAAGRSAPSLFTALPATRLSSRRVGARSIRMAMV